MLQLKFELDMAPCHDHDQHVNMSMFSKQKLWNSYNAVLPLALEDKQVKDKIEKDLNASFDISVWN